MAEIVANFQSAVDTPLAAPANIPTIRIRRTDTQALVVTDLAMTEQGEGNFSFEFDPDPSLEYSIRSDGDPTAAGQTIAGGRYAYGSLSGIANNADLSSLYDLGSGPGIHWDPAGTAGSVLGVNGTATNPVDNETDLFLLASALGTMRIYVGPGTLLLAANHTGFVWEGCGARSVVNPNGNDVGNGCFINVILNGAFGGVLDCELTNGSLFNVTGWQGTARNSRLFNSVAIRPGAFAEFIDCFAVGSLASGVPCEILCGGATATIGTFAGVEGDLVFKNLQNVSSEFLIAHNAGQITLDTTTTAANILRISGNYSLTNNGTITPDLAGQTGAIVDTVLVANHGAGAWGTATGFAVAGDAMDLTGGALASINSNLSLAHGAGTWGTATGFAVPGDAMALTAGERTAIDGVLSAAHGAGAWDGTATAAVVQAGLTAQGYTIARAPLLDNLDAAVSGVPADVDTLITASHGAGNYTTATGFAVAGDAMTLTPAERTAIDGELTAAHGAGAWDGTATAAVVQAGLTAQGYTTGRAPLLDNLDAAVSGVPADVDTLISASHGAGNWITATGFAVAGDAMALTAGERTAIDGVLSASHGAGLWDSASVPIADIQAGLTAQGYTTGRAPLLDNLDAAISAVPAAVDGVLSASHGAGNWITATGFAVAGDAMALTAGERTAIDGVLSAAHGAGLWDATASVGDIQAGLTAQGYTTARAPLLDNLDAAVSGVPAAVDAVLSSVHGAGSWLGMTPELDEVHAALGLKLGSPASFDTATGITVPVDGIEVAITVLGSVVTLERQP